MSRLIIPVKSVGALIVCVVALVSSAQGTELAQADYMVNCQGCHLPDGAGYPARGVPALNNHLGKFLSVEGGRNFLVQVPGSAQSDLNDERLTAVLNWMLTSFSPGELPESFQPYETAEVHRLRQSPLVEVTAVREQLMSRIAAYEKQTPQVK